MVGSIGVALTLAGIHVWRRGQERSIEVDAEGIRLGGKLGGAARETIPWEDVERCELISVEAHSPKGPEENRIRIDRATDEVFGMTSRVLNLYGGATRDAIFAMLRERLESEKLVMPG